MELQSHTIGPGDRSFLVGCRNEPALDEGAEHEDEDEACTKAYTTSRLYSTLVLYRNVSNPSRPAVM